VCKGNFSKKLQKKDSLPSELKFEPCNHLFNVMKACIGSGHQLALKIVK
jgi:hypothetical protein